LSILLALIKKEISQIFKISVLFKGNNPGISGISLPCTTTAKVIFNFFSSTKKKKSTNLEEKVRIMNENEKAKAEVEHLESRAVFYQSVRGSGFIVVG
jgi:hypothetical protein